MIPSIFDIETMPVILVEKSKERVRLVDILDSGMTINSKIEKGFKYLGKWFDGDDLTLVGLNDSGKFILRRFVY